MEKTLRLSSCWAHTPAHHPHRNEVWPIRVSCASIYHPIIIFQTLWGTLMEELLFLPSTLTKQILYLTFEPLLNTQINKSNWRGGGWTVVFMYRKHVDEAFSTTNTVQLNIRATQRVSDCTGRTFIRCTYSININHNSDFVRHPVHFSIHLYHMHL